MHLYSDFSDFSRRATLNRLMKLTKPIPVTVLTGYRQGAESGKSLRKI